MKKSSCGLTASPKKKPAACCLPANDVAGIVTGELCAPVKKEHAVHGARRRVHRQPGLRADEPLLAARVALRRVRRVTLQP